MYEAYNALKNQLNSLESSGNTTSFKEKMASQQQRCNSMELSDGTFSDNGISCDFQGQKHSKSRHPEQKIMSSGFSDITASTSSSYWKSGGSSHTPTWGVERKYL